MYRKDHLLLQKAYTKILVESRNSAFLKELDVLYKKWQDIQSGIKGTIPTYNYDPEGNPYDAPDAGQKVDKKDLPVYYQNIKTDLSNTAHPSKRRLFFKQTDAEVNLEKELLRIFQKYADQKHFNDNVLFVHDFGYSAYATEVPEGVPNRDETEESYLKNENRVHKNVLSCVGRDVHASDVYRNIGTYGMIVKGYVLFAGRGDLASHTTRVAPNFVRDFFKNSGIPKRPSITNVHSTEEEMSSSLRMKDKMRALRKEPALTQEDKNNILNSVVLDKNDGTSIGEALLGNWRIQNWFFSSFQTVEGKEYPFPYKFWKKAYESNIERPVLYTELNTDDPPVRVNLADYFNV